MASKIVFSSRTLIHISFSSGSHAPTMETLPMEAHQPSSEASVQVLMLVLGYLTCLNELNIFFFDHDISYKVSPDNFITALRLSLLYLRDLSLSFNMALSYSRQNWFPGNEDVRVPVKLANSLIFNFGFVGMTQHFP